MTVRCVAIACCLVACLSAAAGARPSVAALEPGKATPVPLCGDGVVVDDGSYETGYGWVPSVVDGRYVQQYDSTLFPVRRLRSVCICWLRTRLDSDVDFEIEFYDSLIDDEGVHRPVDEPYAAVSASTSGVPQGVANGAFYEFSVQGVTIHEGVSFIGVRWDASADNFFFLCADNSPGTAPVEVFFRDEQADGWGRALDTTDPIFSEHKALLLRVVPDQVAAIDIPTLGASGLAMLALLLVAAGVLAVRGRRAGRT